MDYQLLADNIYKYVHLSHNEMQEVFSLVTERSFKRGDYIDSEGDVNRYTNFLVKGSARSFYIDPNGHEHIIQLAITGWWIGDYTSFILQQPGFLYTEALESVETLSISNENLEMIFSNVPKMERFYRLLVQKAYAAFHMRTLQNLSHDAEQRYIAFRAAYPEMDLQISQKHIASYLGMSAEFLSKIKKRIVQKERNEKKKN